MSALPKISIVIPAYNEATLLPLCLESLEQQDYKGEYEIIVADNGSTDRTARIAEAYDAKVVHENDKQGPVFARITGFKAASGDIIASTDADCILPPDWLTSLADGFKDAKVAAIVGGLDFINVNTMAKRLARLLLPVVLAIYGRSFSGANFAVRRNAFDDVGGFDPSYTTLEDYRLSQKLRQAGHYLRLRRDIKVLTSARRFDQRVWKTAWDYLVRNWLAVKFNRPPVLKSLATIREKPFDISRRIIKRPMLIFAIIAVVALTTYLSFDPRFSIYSVARAKTNDKVIALTFDDGPSEPTTNQVLSILKAGDVKATFFVVGDNVERHPDIARQIVADGNLIANHSDSHSFFMAAPPGRILANVNQAQDSIFKATGKKPHFYRPPYGFRTFWGGRAISQNGYFVVTWDDMTYDYWGLSPDRIVKNIVGHAKPGGVIVLHDGREAKAVAPRDNVAAALPQIIQQLKDQGYRFVTLDELFNTPAYR